MCQKKALAYGKRKAATNTKRQKGKFFLSRKITVDFLQVKIQPLAVYQEGTESPNRIEMEKSKK